MKLKKILKIIFSIFVIIFLFGFFIGIIRGSQRDNLQFAIGADPMCSSPESYESYPDERFYDNTITNGGKIYGMWYFLKHSYLYYNDAFFINILFCQKG